METLIQAVSSGMPNAHEVLQVLVRLIAAIFAGGVIGLERERAGKAAGLRTHILVSLGTCVFVLAGVLYGMNTDGVSRVIQGVITGIGFIGAGAILKLTPEHEIRGLTTSAGIWLTSAMGVAIGLGMIGLAVAASVMAVIVLAVVRRFEDRIPHAPDARDEHGHEHDS